MPHITFSHLTRNMYCKLDKTQINEDPIGQPNFESSVPVVKIKTNHFPERPITK